MMTYRESLRIVSAFYGDCVKFWERQGKEAEQAHKLAVKDVEFITTNPYSPQGEALDLEATKDFIAQIAQAGKVSLDTLSMYL